ncbi:hypothetical protein SAMN04487943_1028 [Gracilibacillus orientalis]|uniref:Uncharacterized protein n=1 Tax=Gracilibacillus orientalis TaxID=334253 RepID=A0A1I4IB55_9BACI|nr:hypothetical protein [Gracilibacillus orientalis]SFL51534.1 hypothetical protein SAMN04487943_1028 [Gracilibacillus orientalis]
MKDKRQTKNTNDKIKNKKDHEFSEELSDGGERDTFIKRQTGRTCGGL